ncbi:hypothetical protein EDB81DRAFT_862928 [Dactylonectria macrodidyma]|uniref:Uncharacterized protein n=1 Tax=Dactylonectria macrodidyma TaxID=307937 RepID=A0A9P9D2I8_9HYPO|nr:hypothetical protein EDB81DRAFT_862928 [Dactylonectria macrodidyma]
MSSLASSMAEAVTRQLQRTVAGEKHCQKRLVPLLLAHLKCDKNESPRNGYLLVWCGVKGVCVNKGSSLDFLKCLELWCVSFGVSLGVCCLVSVYVTGGKRSRERSREGR